MFTTLEKNEITLIREKSSFIGILVHATSVESAKQYLVDIKKEYPKAKHYCYAYSIGGLKKSSDDGEPAGTAGRPLLELLNKKEMDETLLVVVRYFGGVLLGASRLMSTYLETGVQAINTADIVEIKHMYGYKVTMSYKDFEELKRLGKSWGFSFENIQYEDKIIVEVLGEENAGETLANAFPHASIDLIGNRKVYRR